jgi:hypothetical protein
VRISLLHAQANVYLFKQTKDALLDTAAAWFLGVLTPPYRTTKKLVVLTLRERSKGIKTTTAAGVLIQQRSSYGICS